MQFDLSKIEKDVESDVYDKLMHIMLTSKNYEDFKKKATKHLRGMKHQTVNIEHISSDDEFRCKTKDGSITCKRKDSEGSWHKVNKTKLDIVEFMQYISRPPEKHQYGLHCEYLEKDKAIDCDYIRKDRLKPPKGSSDKYEWSGPPGFKSIECKPFENADFMVCTGSSELEYGTEKKKEKKYEFDETKSSWIPKSAIVEEDVISGLKRFNEINLSKKKIEGNSEKEDAFCKMISLATQNEPDIDGITTIEYTEREHRGTDKNPSRMVVVSSNMYGKPFDDTEPESKRWVDQQDAGKIGQGTGKGRHKSQFPEDMFL